ncbi:MAG: Ig-like domain-containing protein [Bacteroidales bacterium]|nr:Ig-like domain-containing protein [Bacteroidales bacterium]
MKRIIFVIAVLCLLVACQNENKPIDEEELAVVNVTGIVLTPSAISVKIGESEELMASVTPENATNQKINWVSSDDSIATVDDGIITGIKIGNVSIIATSEDGGKTAFCQVTVVNNLPPSVSLGAEHISAVSAVLNCEANLNSALSAETKTGILWSVNAGGIPSEATRIEAKEILAKEGIPYSYSYSVNLTGLEENTTYFYCSFSNEGDEDNYGEIVEFKTKEFSTMLETIDATDITATSATLNGKADLSELVFVYSEESIEYGFLWGKDEDILEHNAQCGTIEEINYSFTLTDLSHKTKYWYKSFLQLEDMLYCGAVKSFTTDMVSVESITLDKNEYTFTTIGETLNLNATVLPEDATNKGITWKTNKAEVATVDESGKVTAIGNGIATITVTTEDQSKTAICTITVAQAVTGIILTPSSVTIKEEASVTLVPTITPDNAVNKNVTWKSNNNDVATINNGVVTGIKAGSAIITATTEDGGKTATCSITVERNLAPSETICAEQISAISVILKGKANLGTTVSSDLKVGFQLSKSAGILPSNSITLDAENVQSDYSYSNVIKGLDPATTYYFRSFVRQNNVDTYGETKTFTTKDIVSMLETMNASDVSAISACLNAKLDLTDVVYSNAVYGFYWGESIGSMSDQVTAKEGTGSMSFDLSGLTPSKEYFFQAYLVLDGKEFKGDIVSFITRSLIETLDVTNLSAISATLNAKIDFTNVNKYYTDEFGFDWGESAETLSKRGTVKEEYGLIKLDISGLIPSKKYFFQSYIVFDEKKYKGDIVSFTTRPLIETLDVTDITATSAVLNAKIDFTNIRTNRIEYGFKWGETGYSESQTEKVGNVNIDTFSASLSMLYPSTVYWIQAYVKLDNKTFYGNSRSFSTKTQPVESVRLDKSEVTFKNIGNTIGLNATILPSNATNKSKTWSSDNENVVTVNEKGVVTAVGLGTAIVTVKTIDQGKTASCLFTVKHLVNSITLNKTKLIMNQGEEEILTASVYPKDAINNRITWTSSDESVATVDNTGMVMAKSRGSATITATANDGSGVKAICKVEVTQHVTSITLAPTLSIAEGQEQILTATVNPSNANDNSLTWTSSDESVATVDQSGKVMAKSKGTTIIKAAANDGSGIFATCSVTVMRLVSSIVLDKTSVILYRRNSNISQTIAAIVSPSTADNTSVTWSSSDISVVSVSGSGIVTANARGTATITVTANDGGGAKATCEVEVIQYVTSILLDNISLAEGQVQSLSTTVVPATANDPRLAYKSSDESIATVDQTGKVTAKSRGRTVLTVTANDGSNESASCGVYVCPPGSVDMGLTTPEGKILYWATSNICEDGFVSSPEEYGDYYAWGEVEPYYAKGHSQDSPCINWRTIEGKAITGYNWASYKWCNGSSRFFTKYNPTRVYGTFDNKTVLDPEDDVAHIKLGGSWRMPTDAEWVELKNNCTWTWIENYNGTGINGQIITSKINGIKIFLPATGLRCNTGNSGVGSFGGYWSSSLTVDYPWDACSGADIDSKGVYSNCDDRCIGRSIRPVLEY